MIQLFKVPDYTIDTSKFKNLLHDPIRDQVEGRVGDYVHAEHCIGVTSCTAGIFLALKSLNERYLWCKVPSLVTTRFLGAIIHAGGKYSFTDDNTWVGKDYVLFDNLRVKIIDSAQRFDPGQFDEYNYNDVVVFSNYPTKPLGGVRGGFICTNDANRARWIRQAAYFGEKFAVNSWEGQTGFVGWQLYMDSVQAYVINQSLDNYQHKRDRLDTIRALYNMSDMEVVTGDSYHLFRVRVKDNIEAMTGMYKLGIMTGIHYKAAHEDEVYGKLGYYPDSMRDSKTALSIPFHENITNKDVSKIYAAVRQFR